MSTLSLNNLKCERLQDSISEDEIEVLVDGKHVVGPIGVHKGQTVSLGGVSRTFTGSVAVQLREIDSGSDEDSLGIRPVSASSPSGTLIFDAAKHAYYTLSYRVT